MIDAIVDFELNLSHAQLVVPGVGRLDSDGALGGPEAFSSQPLIQGRFDLYDAWIDSDNPRRAQIATLRPKATNWRAISAPSPELAPVIKMFLRTQTNIAQSIRYAQCYKGE